jgi:hypothetical protein
MAAGYDIGLSVATASGAQGGTASTGDINIGGSGGVNKAPWYVWAGLAVLGAIFLFKVLFPSKRKR